MPERAKVAFFVGLPVHFVIFRSIYRHLPEAVLLVEPVEANPAALYLELLGIPYRVAGETEPAVVVLADHCYLDRFGGTTKTVHTFHSLAEKRYTFHPENSRFDLLLLPGRYAWQKFTRMGIEKGIVVGLPKLDPVFDGSFNRWKVRWVMGAGGNRPVLLYAPTWNGFSSVPLVGTSVSALARDYHVWVKLHDLSPPAWVDMYGRLPAATLISDPDSVPYVLAADVVLTDASGIMFEAAVMDRPVVLFDCNLDQYDRMAAEYSWRDIGLRVDTVRDLPGALRRTLEHPDDFAAARRACADLLVYGRDGLSGHRAAAAIRRLMGAPAENMTIRNPWWSRWLRR